MSLNNRYRWFRSLKSRLVLWILLPTALLLLIDIAVIYRNSESIATSVQKVLLHGSAEIISDQLFYNEGTYDISIPPAAFELFKSRHRDHVYYAVHSQKGTLIAGGDELPPYPNRTEIEEPIYFMTSIDGEPVRVIVFAHALTNAPSDEFAVTQVAQTLRGHDEFRDGLILSTVRGHLLLLSITVVALFIALRWTLQPLMRFSQMLAQRSPGSLDMLDERTAPTELQPVIHALNAYAEKLRHTLSSYERFVSNTAHHLRTSFAIMSSQIDFARRNSDDPRSQTDTLDSIRKTMGESSKLINQLLVLASVEQNRRDRSSDAPVRLSEIIAQVIEQMAPLAQQKGIELGVDDFDETLFVSARPHLLQEIFSNLISNAVQHMGKPGSVTVSLRRDGDRAHIVIADDGIGVPQEMQARIFERFFRIDPGRANGTGLGLAIVKEICDVIEGTVSVSTPSNGVGLQFDLLFPLSSGHA